MKAGNRLLLEVPFDGSPPPVVQWKKNDAELKANKHVSITNEDELTTILVNEADRSDAGEYVLTLTNDSGTFTTKCNINVQGQFRKMSSNV